MYTDLLTKLRNAQKARKEMLKLPFSNMDFAVAELLGKYNFVENVSKKGRMPKRVIEIKLKYDDKGQGAIGGVRFISKPSRRIYLGYKDLKAVRQGYGISALSTPKGVMSNLQARKDKVGGQLLFEIW
ncbi:MAG: small subunit ribosomal protein S8 [Parcubacteria group bacterium Gr01-1014_3]|nr:MAG: small subunit ribosomal protein S8 [Parcubacteria group bacterium Gr01-1014_3]